MQANRSRQMMEAQRHAQGLAQKQDQHKQNLAHQREQHAARMELAKQQPKKEKPTK